MDKNNRRFLITGALGYIGSSLIKALNDQGYYNIIISDYNWTKKWQNIVGLRFHRPILHPTEVKENIKYCHVVYHLGANSSTQAENSPEVWAQNYEYSVELIKEAKKHNRKVIFASSAATYGAEEKNFTERVYDLTPQSFYAYTKLSVDQYIIENEQLSDCLSVRFFNVFGGAKERFKGNMSSVIYRWLTQDISETNKIKLFESLRPEIKSGFQSRDFVAIWDVCKVLVYLGEMDKKGVDIINLGSGKARTWLDIANCVLETRGLNKDWIEFVPLPDAIKNQYQYFTQSDNSKLINKHGYKEPFMELEDAIRETYKEIKS
jgi:ADP-L-glycero-D-manno-heptose 6-epimerase